MVNTWPQVAAFETKPLTCWVCVPIPLCVCVLPSSVKQLSQANPRMLYSGGQFSKWMLPSESLSTRGSQRENADVIRKRDLTDAHAELWLLSKELSSVLWWRLKRSWAPRSEEFVNMSKKPVHPPLPSAVHPDLLSLFIKKNIMQSTTRPLLALQFQQIPIFFGSCG